MNLVTRAVFKMSPHLTSELITGHLTFYDDSGTQLSSVVATSGMPNFQSPQHYRIRGKGLIPPYKGLRIVTAGYPLTTLGVEGMFYPIVPDPIPGYGRSEIGLHRDANVPGSAGCIVVVNSDSFKRLVVPLLSKAASLRIREIDLTVDYDRVDTDSDEIDIMARTIFGEARGEPDDGKVAVGWVIKNRSDAGGWWGDDIREVCLKPYQFSCWNFNDVNRPVLLGTTIRDPIFKKCLEIASLVLKGRKGDPTGGANHYHSQLIEPTWAKGKKPTVVIGNHLFYRL